MLNGVEGADRQGWYPAVNGLVNRAIRGALGIMINADHILIQEGAGEHHHLICDHFPLKLLVS